MSISGLFSSVTGAVQSVGRLPIVQKLNQTVADVQNTFDSLGSTSNSTINPVNADQSGTSSGNKISFKPLPNPLNAYDQTTYSIRFSIISDDPNKNDEVVIAETGKTNLNIQSLRIDTYPGVNAHSRNTTATTMELKIYEPMGANLPDLFVAAAKSIGVRNYTKSMMKITIKFQGFDPGTGQPNTNIVDRDWCWKVVLTEMHTKVNEQGSIHTLTLVVMNNVGFNDQYAKFPEAIVIPQSGSNLNTVGSVLKYVIGQMNADSTKNKKGITYKISDIPYKKPIGSITRPFENTVGPDSPKTNTSRNSDASISNGTSIMSFIDILFASSPTAVKIIASATRSPDNPSTGNLDVTSTFHMVESVVTYGEFNPRTNDYDKTIEYIIHPYETVRIATNVTQADQITDRDKNQKKAEFLVQNKRLAKLYDYIFTGNNTEVLKFDINLNFMWCLLVDNAMGEIHQDQVTTPQVANDDAINRTNKAQRDDLANSSTKQPSDNDVSSATTAPSTENRLPPTVKVNRPPTITYVDDLYYQNQKSFELFPIATMQAGANNRAQVSNFIKGEYSKQRSAYGMLLNQLYDGGVAEYNMISITLSIRGDPYWLGSDLTEKTTSGPIGIPLVPNSAAPAAGAAISQPGSTVSGGNPSTGTNTFTDRSTSANYPQFLDGEYVFVLRFNIPQGYDEGTGTPKIVQNEMYTGFYYNLRVEHVFQDGGYEQVLHGTRILGMEVNELLNITYGK